MAALWGLLKRDPPQVGCASRVALAEPGRIAADDRGVVPGDVVKDIGRRREIGAARIAVELAGKERDRAGRRSELARGLYADRRRVDVVTVKAAEMAAGDGPCVHFDEIGLAILRQDEVQGN